MPPPKPDALVIRWLVVAKLPFPVMFAAVGAWPIWSAAAGLATITAPVSRPTSMVATAARRTTVDRNRRRRVGISGAVLDMMRDSFGERWVGASCCRDMRIHASVRLPGLHTYLR